VIISILPELEVVNVLHCPNPFSDDYEMDIYIPIKLGKTNGRIKESAPQVGE
jgi:hypothetical protein